MGFGQHQSFYLRPQWLYKGIKEVKENPRFFYDNTHFEQLGIGKNMAKSAKYWLLATSLLEEKKQSGKTEHHITQLGSIINKYDTYIQHPLTKSILHYKLTSDSKVATTWFWFFNVYKEVIFDKTTLLESLEKWVNSSLKKSISINSLKRDIDCLIQMYNSNNLNSATPEDVIRSPFEDLFLISNTVKSAYKKTAVDIAYKHETLFITLLLFLEQNEISEVGLDEIVSGEGMWGKIYNLSRTNIIDSLEEMQKVYPISFTRTNRLDVVRLTKETYSLEYLEHFFEKEVLV